MSYNFDFGSPRDVSNTGGYDGSQGSAYPGVSQGMPASGPMLPPTPDGQDNVENAALKRRIAQLEAEKERPSKQSKDDVKNLGRMYMRLVDLYTSPHDLIAALDAHAVLGDRARAGDPQAQEECARYNRVYNSGMLMLKKIPRIQLLMRSESEDAEDKLRSFCTRLGDGSTRARSDDFIRIRDSLVDWIKEIFEPARRDELLRGTRENRGMMNDLVGRLLCPYEWNWDDPVVRSDIRNGLKDTSEEYYFRVLYTGHDGPPLDGDLEEGFLKSRLLTYLAIFTAPSSAETLGKETAVNDPIPRKGSARAGRRPTRTTNAALMNMEGQVTPRSIAYAAVLLLLNLTPTTQWVHEYHGFNYQDFYAFIVDYFECQTTPVGIRQSAELLKWWNMTIFPNHRNPKATGTSSKSRAKLAAARANKENMGPAGML